MAKQNKHLDHLEDRIILEGRSGAQAAIDLLKGMLQFLTGNAGPNMTVTTKWDGAPAVVCGIDPEDGRFFVGTKSVFNKQEPKICKTVEDIERYYEGQLANKLRDALTYLPGCVTKGILQGDLMFTNDKKHERIEGKEYITFRPNTITYAANPATPLGKRINMASLGIVFHTKYTGDSIKTATAGFDVKPSDFRLTGQVWAERAEFQDITGVAVLASDEKQRYESYIKQAEGSLSKCQQLLDDIQTGKKALQLDTEFLKFFNNYVKAGRVIPSAARAYEDFKAHLGAEYDKAMSGKQQGTQKKKAEAWAKTLYMYIQRQREFYFLIATYMNLQGAKHILVNRLKKVSSLNLFVDKGGGDYVATTPEGFVAIKDGRATKLIDRLEFSKLNFTIPKVWG